MIRWSRLFAVAVSAAATAVLLAAPPTPPATTPNTAQPKSTTLKPVKMPAGVHQTIPVIPDHPGVHINSVKLEGNCGQPPTFVVEIQNNLRIQANTGDVVVKADTRSAQGRFTNLRPGEKRTIRIPTTFTFYCQRSEELNVPVCYEVFVTMEPDGVSAGQVWDGVYHKVCETSPATAASQTPLVTDTQHK